MASDPLPLTPSRRSRMIERSPIFYGWIILLAGTFGIMMTQPGQTVGVSVFLDSIISDLGLSRTSVSLMYTFGTLLGSFALPFVGRFIDRRGPRLAVIVISSLFALACIWMGFIGGLLTLFIGFTLIRSLGQGSLSLVSMHVINLWFVRRRGLAIGLTGIGTALAVGGFPILIELLVNQFGWRQAYMLLGGLVAITILPVGAWLYRGHPESYGLVPDGNATNNLAKPINETNYTAPQARRTVIFWAFAAGNFLVSGLGTGLVFHHYSIMETGGLERLTASTMFSFLGLAIAAANLITGILMDRIPPRFLLSFVLLLLCLDLYLATVITAPLLILYGATIGLTFGMNGTMQSAINAYYFGRKHLGAIKGFATTISVAGSAFGPFLFALGFEGFGNYQSILLLSALFPLLLAAIALFIKPPKNI